jgi:hypothetical protein
MLLVPFDLFVQLFESRDPAVARPPEPVLQIRLCLLHIRGFQEQTRGLLETIRTIKLRVIHRNQIQTNLLLLCKMLWSLAECVAGILDLFGIGSGFLDRGGFFVIRGRAARLLWVLCGKLFYPQLFTVMR